MPGGNGNFGNHSFRTPGGNPRNPNGSIASPSPAPAPAAPSPAPAFDSSYIDPNQAFQGNQGASELFGKLNRAQWEDWKTRFAPYITKLADYATDPNAASNAAEQAKSSVGLAFDTATTVNNQNRERYGVSLSPEQMAAQERATKVGKSAATVSAGNEARISALDRQQSILAGGMGLSNIPDRVMNS